MTAKELISQYVDTGLKLPEYQVNKLSNQDKKTYIRKRLIAAQSGGYLDLYEMELLNPDEKDNYISKLDSEGIATLIRNSTDEDKIAEMIINAKGNTLGGYEIKYVLLKYSKDKDKIAEMIINAMGDKLDSRSMTNLLDNSTDKVKIAEMINNAFGYDKVKEFLSGLDSEIINNALLDDSNDTDGLKRLFDKYGIDYPKNESVRASLRKTLLG